MYHLPDPERQYQFYEGVPVKRLLAWVVDTVLIAILCVVAIPFTAFVGLFFLPLLFAVLSFVYRVATLAGGSATLGMRFAAIEFRTMDGERLDGSTALLHTIGYYLSFAFPIAQVISVVMMLTGARGQGLTDMVLGTVVLNRRSAG
ncbi:MAG: RDD family protein [Paracoccaceae bacterium]